jgi:hypothetical protein
MSTPWSTAASVARGVLRDALAGRPPDALVPALARTNLWSVPATSSGSVTRSQQSCC